MRIEYSIPSRCLFGYRSEFLTDTRGEGIMSSVLDSYAPMKGEIERRSVGSLISFESGEAVTYGLHAAQERGSLFIGPGTPVYAGMVVGICSRNEDMNVNVCKRKQLTNMRASGSDEALRLVTPRVFSLEQNLEFLADDELLECTPKSLRIRKRELDHGIRMRETMKRRAAAAEGKRAVRSSRIFSKRATTPRSRPPFPMKSWEGTMCSSCPTSWASAVPSTTPTPAVPSSA